MTDQPGDDDIDLAPTDLDGCALDAYGRCPSCGEDFSACPGVYHCPNCSED